MFFIRKWNYQQGNDFLLCGWLLSGFNPSPLLPNLSHIWTRWHLLFPMASIENTSTQHLPLANCPHMRPFITAPNHIKLQCNHLNAFSRHHHTSLEIQYHSPETLNTWALNILMCFIQLISIFSSNFWKRFSVYFWSHHGKTWLWLP